MSLPILKKKKNKVFVSQAMQHATPEQVHKERDQIMNNLKLVYPEHQFELIEQYHVAEPAEWKDKTPRALRWARLARSIVMMADADIIVFAESFMNTYAAGCQAEHTVAMAYKAEYDTDEYYVIHANELERYIKGKGLNPLQKNINNCIDADMKIFMDYYEELMSIVRKFIPVNEPTAASDTENNWYVEFVNTPYYICAELSKQCLVDEEDYDNGEFFKFVFEYEFGWKSDETSKIVIKSYNNGQTKGLKVDEYKLSPNETIPIGLFELLRGVCE